MLEFLRYLRQEFLELKKLPTLWTPSFLVATTGNASTETIERYIENKKGK